MKLNTNSNTYIIIYSTILVVAVAILLSVVFKGLEEQQQKNVELDLQKQVLYSLNLRDSIGGLTDEEIISFYQTVVTKTDSVADEKGKKKPYVYHATVDGEPKYVLPLKGQGMWGGISAFLALNADKQTVYGVYFNHESETAGLGAEIKDNADWQKKFRGKQLFAADGTLALSVEKGKTNETTVDAVTGATVTSTAVSKMLHDQLDKYRDFLSMK